MPKFVSQLLTESQGAIFRAYMAVVLIQFAFLSFMNVELCAAAAFGDRLHDLFLSSSFWWGQFSLFGALSLVLRSKLVGWKLGALMGDVAAVCTFTFLSIEYLTSKPPIYAGGIMAATAVLFLIGGLIYERRSP